MRKWPMKWLVETQRWLTIIKISIFFYTTISTTAAGFACISNPCINGICIDDLNSTYTCYCIDGYTGIQCQTNWDECWSSPCLNGGSCIDGIASYNCTCVEGYTGENCEQDINECISNPCLNGICTDVLNGYECQCFPGYTGINCEIDQTVCNISDEIRCENNGLCIDGPGLTYTCKCQPGWHGQKCENNVNECLSSPCQNGAICIDMHANYACACPFGYTGHNCETELELCELNLCENGALCIMENEVRVCYCVPDYHGDKCQYQYDECLLKGRCLNGGTCVDGVDSYTCSCPPKVTGPNCECYIHTDGEYDCMTTLSPYNTTTEHETTTAFFETVTSFRDVVHLTAKTRHTSSTTEQVYFHWLTPDTSPTHVTPVLTEKSNVTNVTIFRTKISGTEHTIFKANTESAETSQYSTSLTTAPTVAYTTEDRTLVDFYTSQTGITVSEVITEITETTWNELSLPDTTTSKDETNVPNTEEYATPPTENVTTNGQISSATEIKQSTFDTTMKQLTDVTTSDQFTSVEHSPTEYCEPHTTYYEVTGTWPENTKATEMTLVDDWNVTTFFTETFSSMQCSKTCLNGGTCHVTLDDSKCVCRFGWSGPSCENAVNIKVVAFTGRSYLIHYLNNGTSTVISLKLKTLSTLGVLFFTQVTSNMYMYLYVQDGFLKFQFSCGVQTMLFSETKYRISTGFETLVLATVKFNMNIQNEEGECNAALRINNTVAMSGEQTTATEQKLLNLPVLYIGGFPRYLLQQLDVPVTNGIIGCMHSLQVDGINRDIYMDAFDGSEITECSSLACISNPCHQAATCIEEGHSWNCICPSGYVGKVCNISVCNDNPCQFGATCVPYSTNGFLCLCPLGKHGLFCEQDLEISQPTFSSIIRGYSSFIAYRMPINSMFHTFELRLKFIPESMEQISLMVFIGQENWQSTHSDYLSLSFIKGYIALTWNLGAGPRRIFTPRPIMKKGKKMHSIKIGKSGPRAWLYVDGFKNITGKSLGRHTQLNVTPVIYIGGHESFNFENLPHDLPLHSGFAGCIYDVELHTSHIVLGLQKTHPITGRAVAQCGTSECSNYTCQHGGICLQYGPTFSCLCPDGWFGPVCAYRYNLCDPNYSKCVAGSTCVPFATTYECDCPVGRTGKYCEKIETQLSDIHFSGQRSYLQLLIPKNFHTKQFGLEFEMKPLTDRSLVLYAVEPESEFFISLLLIGGILEFRIFIFDSKKLDTGTDIMSVKSGTIIPLGEWTKIRAGRFGQKLYLSVNGITNSRVMPADTNVMLKKLLIHFGGSENLANIPFKVTSGLPVSYYGCIRKFFINYKHMALNENSISSGRNIADCDGTPCGADVCANGGTCWLNTTLKPHCMCPQEYQGDRCEIQVSCNLAPCRNGGRCVTNNNSLICHCPLGWIGSFCEKEMPAVTPFLKGNSYIIIDKRTIHTKKRHLLNKTTARNDFIYIKFSTTENNGLLLWNTKADNFFGIGIDESNLKIVWSLNGSVNKFTIDTNLTVNNGVWHSVKFKSNDSTISLTVDNEEIYVENLEATNNFVIFDDLFYIGGFPEKKVLSETNGIFISNFNGCIEEFAWNEHMVISNFKYYKGENVGNCFENKG